MGHDAQRDRHPVGCFIEPGGRFPFQHLTGCQQIHIEQGQQVIQGATLRMPAIGQDVLTQRCRDLLRQKPEARGKLRQRGSIDRKRNVVLEQMIILQVALQIGAHEGGAKSHVIQDFRFRRRLPCPAVSAIERQAAQQID